MTDVNRWWPLYPADFAIDTADMTAEQVGALILLLNQYWRTGGNLPADDCSLANLSRLSQKKWQRIKPTVARFFVADPDGRWRHKKLDAELVKALENVQKKREAGRRGGLKKKANAVAHAKANAIAPANENSKQMLGVCSSKTLAHHHHLKDTDQVCSTESESLGGESLKDFVARGGRFDD